jgi:Predicted solute binding protein
MHAVPRFRGTRKCVLAKHSPHTSGQETGRQKCSRPHFQACRGERLAGRPRKATQTSRDGSTYLARAAAIRPPQARSVLSSTSVHSKTCLVKTNPETSSRRTNGSTQPTGTWSYLTSTTSGPGETTRKNSLRVKMTLRRERRLLPSSAPASVDSTKN